MISEIETNYVCFSGLLLKRYPELFESLEAALERRDIPYGLITGTRDIWCRDYMPIQVAEDSFVQFKYDPRYLRYKKYRHTITDVDGVCEAMGIKPVKSKIRLDGGNVVTSGSKVIITDRIFKENPNRGKKRLVEELKELLQVERVIIIPECPGDMTGHADGLVRFPHETEPDNDTVYVSDLSCACPRYFPKLCSALTQVGLTPRPMPYDSPKKYDRIDATGTYINYLQVGKFVFYPAFGSKADAFAGRIFSKLFGSDAVPIKVGKLAKEGGVLNCISWNVFRKKRMKKINLNKIGNPMLDVSRSEQVKDLGMDGLLLKSQERLPFRPVDLTHSHFYQHRNILHGIWWYNVKTKALLYSQTAKSHIDSEFQAQITGETLSIKEGAEDGSWINKSDALKKGWISGRTGSYGGDWFAFVYTEQLSALPLDVRETLLKVLGGKIGNHIRHLTDPAGNILLEKKVGQ